MKNMGVADVILGMKITKTSDGYSLSQSHYIKKILCKFIKDDMNVARTPVNISLYLSKNTDASISHLEYSQIIGSLMYLMNCTTPDVAYAVSKLSRYTSNPRFDHWKAIIRVLRYLRHTQNYGFHYTKYPAVLEGTVMQIGFQILKTQNPLVDMSLHWEVLQSLEKLLSRHA